MANIELRPTYWASIIGGKDSFYMLYLILQNLDKYPLDGCVYYDLETDFPFIKDVIDYIESECKRFGITMFRIKPRTKWIDLYNKQYGNGRKFLYPTRRVRWCNGRYKLDCKKQLEDMMKSQGKRVVHYIGFCADELKRFKYDIANKPDNVKEIYPLAEMGIIEDDILNWARKQEIYNGYYLENRRCGCICCPMADLNSLVYVKTHYPNEYEYYMNLAEETEKIRAREYNKEGFSVWTSDAKYDTKYKRKRVDEIISEREAQTTIEI